MIDFVSDLKTIKEKYDRLKTFVELAEQIKPVIVGLKALQEMDVDKIAKDLGIEDLPKIPSSPTKTQNKARNI